MFKIFVHFWIELKPMLLNASCFCKNMNHMHKHYQECEATMFTSFYTWGNVNNPSSYIGDAQKSFHILSCQHCLSISILSFCPRHEPPCFFFWILKSNPIWFIRMYTKGSHNHRLLQRMLENYLVTILSNVLLLKNCYPLSSVQLLVKTLLNFFHQCDEVLGGVNVVGYFPPYISAFILEPTHVLFKQICNAKWWSRGRGLGGDHVFRTSP
jgi:hypothetical protein